MAEIQQTKFQSSFESWVIAQHHVLREYLKLMTSEEKNFMNHIVVFEYPLNINKVLFESGLATNRASVLLDFFEKNEILKLNKKVNPGQVSKGKYYDLLVSANNDL